MVQDENGSDDEEGKAGGAEPPVEIMTVDEIADILYDYLKRHPCPVCSGKIISFTIAVNIFA